MASKSTFIPQFLHPEKPLPIPVEPAEPGKITLDQAYKLLDCDTVQLVPLGESGYVLLIDENGKYTDSPKMNLLASVAWYQQVPQARGVDCIVGPAILCHNSQF
jgi:hypothetical protein